MGEKLLTEAWIIQRQFNRQKAYSNTGDNSQKLYPWALCTACRKLDWWEHLFFPAVLTACVTLERYIVTLVSCRTFLRLASGLLPESYKFCLLLESWLTSFQDRIFQLEGNRYTKVIIYEKICNAYFCGMSYSLVTVDSLTKSQCLCSAHASVSHLWSWSSCSSMIGELFWG